MPVNWYWFFLFLRQFIGWARSWQKENPIFKKNTKMITVVKLEKDIAGTDILSIVILKFSHKQELCPVFLVLIDGNLQLNLHYSVLSLGLAICLRIKCNWKLLLNIKEVKKQSPELWSKRWALTTNNKLKKTVMPE